MPRIAVFLVVAGAQVSLFAQATLQITNPAPGTVVNPGQTVVVNVSAFGGPFTSVTIIAPGYIKGLAALTSPPYQFSFTVPPIPSQGITPGINTLAAVGSTASGVVFSAAVPVDIERADSPQSIATDSSQLELPIGGQVDIQVFGKYSDGSVVDLSQSTQTTYTSHNPSIATVDAAGFVTAVAPGSTTIVVRHRGPQRTVRVAVVRTAK